MRPGLRRIANFPVGFAGHNFEEISVGADQGRRNVSQCSGSYFKCHREVGSVNLNLKLLGRILSFSPFGYLYSYHYSPRCLKIVVLRLHGGTIPRYRAT